MRCWKSSRSNWLRCVSSSNEIYNDCYGDGQTRKIIDSFSDEEMMELARNLRKRCAYGDPVFDGAKESEIKSCYVWQAYDDSGQVSSV